MAKALPFILAGFGLLVAGGVAFAASSGGSGGQAPALPPSDTDDEAALVAIATGDASRMRSAGLVVASRSPAIAAGLVAGAQFLDDLSRVPTDVAALARAAVRTCDPMQMAGVASILQTRTYNDQAKTLIAFAGYVEWLKRGAPAGIATSTLEPTLPTPSAQPTAAQAEEIAATIATRDPAKIRALAGRYAAAGNTEAANSLNAAANAIESTNAGAPAPKIVDGGVVPSTTTSPKVAEPPTYDGKLLAGKVAIAMRTATKDKNGKTAPASAVELVRMFQVAEKLSRLDGSYGSETALAVAERYGIVPPKPLYWGAKGGNYKTLVADKTTYKTRLAKLAANDPQRSDEWAKAMAV